MSAPPVLLISLPQASQLRALAAAQLDHAGIRFEFLDAIDYGKLEQRQLDAIDPTRFLMNTGRCITAAEIAEFASHRRAWLACVRAEVPVVILEDHCVLLAGFSEALALCNEWIDEVGIIRFQAETNAAKRRVTTAGRYTLWRYTRAPCCKAAYLLSPTAATMLLRESSRIAAPIDDFLRMFWLHRQLIYGLTPYTIARRALAPDSVHAGNDGTGTYETDENGTGRNGSGISVLTRARRVNHKMINATRRIYANLTVDDAKGSNRF